MDANQLAQIQAVMVGIEYPITVAYIVQLTALDKKIVNRILSANPTMFQKLVCKPPLWRVIAPTPPPVL
jgi:hypothetical protein